MLIGLGNIGVMFFVPILSERVMESIQCIDNFGVIWILVKSINNPI